MLMGFIFVLTSHIIVILFKEGQGTLDAKYLGPLKILYVKSPLSKPQVGMSLPINDTGKCRLLNYGSESNRAFG